MGWGFKIEIGSVGGKRKRKSKKTVAKSKPKAPKDKPTAKRVVKPSNPKSSFGSNLKKRMWGEI
jgi:hypothetical protein